MPLKSRAKVASDRAKWNKQKESHMKRVAEISRKRTIITAYQKMAMQILDEAWIEYIQEKPILNRRSFYLIDIYIPEHKICIEVDGSSHELPENIASDKIRDNFLRKSWYWVMRIKNEEVRHNLLWRLRWMIKARNAWIEKNNPL